MSQISKPNTFSASTTIASSEVNDNFDTIYNDYNGSIDANNLASGAVTTAKIADSNVTTAKIADSNVTTAKIADSNVTTAKINNGAVTPSKLDLDPATATVATSETTTSTSYADLATTTDSVTVTIGANGLALIAFSCRLSNSSTSDNRVAVDISGASTVAAADAKSLALFTPNTSLVSMSYCYLATGLTAGSTTFKMKYRVSAGTGTFLNRNISVIPL